MQTQSNMAAPKMVRMPRLDSGKECPNPIRWVCDQGHTHPSRWAAIKCNRKTRDVVTEPHPYRNLLTPQIKLL